MQILPLRRPKSVTDRSTNQPTDQRTATHVLRATKITSACLRCEGAPHIDGQNVVESKTLVKEVINVECQKMALSLKT